jgi:hypothetical protein
LTNKLDDGGEAVVSEPADVVLEYIDAYYRWNEAAEQQKLRLISRLITIHEIMQQAADLLAPYFLAASYQRPGSFGYPSMHEPGREVVQSVQLDGEQCVVITRLTQNFGTAVFELDYEYHLRRDGDRWLIERIVDPPDGGRLVSS